jgi:hypothetical protein
VNGNVVSIEMATYEGAPVVAKQIPVAYALEQNYPNPFNPSTALSADMPTAGPYTLTIYNIAGQVVKTFQGRSEAGTLEIEWQGVDDRGARVASGVYFYAFKAGDFSDVRKMVLMK